MRSVRDIVAGRRPTVIGGEAETMRLFRAFASVETRREPDHREDEDETGHGQGDAQPRGVLAVRLGEQVRCAEEEEEADVEGEDAADRAAVMQGDEPADRRRDESARARIACGNDATPAPRRWQCLVAGTRGLSLA